MSDGEKLMDLFSETGGLGTGIIADIIRAGIIESTAYNIDTLNSVGFEIREALSGAFFRKTEQVESLLSGDINKAVEWKIARIYQLNAPEIRPGRMLFSWQREALTKDGACGVYPILEKIDAERANDGLPPLDTRQRRIIATGLFILTENSNIAEEHHGKLLESIDHRGGEKPVVRVGNSVRGAKAGRLVSSNTQFGNAMTAVQSGDKFEITLSKKEGKKLVSGKMSGTYAEYAGRLEPYDIFVCATAFRVAKDYVAVDGPFRYLAPPHRAIAKAYFNNDDEPAVQLIAESLDRLRNSGIENLDPSDAIREMIIDMPTYATGLTRFWPGERCMVRVNEKAGFRTAGDKATEPVFLEGERLAEVPIRYRIDASLGRLRAVRKEVRPNIRIDALTESIFSVMLRRLLMVAETYKSGGGKMTVKGIIERIGKTDANPKTYKRIRDTIEKILCHWENHGMAQIERLTVPNRVHVEELDTFWIRPPEKDENGNAFPNKTEAGEWMRNKISEPFTDDLKTAIPAPRKKGAKRGNREV